MRQVVRRPRMSCTALSAHVFIMKRKFNSYQEVCISKRKAVTMALPIQLTPSEERLKLLLLDVASFINTTRPSPHPVHLRWAGGWVRDKLLGIETHDIDVAINCMTGEDFGRQLGQFCDLPSTIEKYAITKKDLGNLHTIKANPAKSKNLATATCRLFGAEVDFVNLRKEVYTEKSRNPEIEFGSPQEDALRRDATVNALFYNLHTSQVEDFTSGISDLKAKIIRTPLEPFQTFMDDPLRVLRLVRFASRLGFAIDKEAERMMGDRRVLEAFQAKISRERVGIEVKKMLEGRFSLVPNFEQNLLHLITMLTILVGKRPHTALSLIDRLGLYHAIFKDPSAAHSPGPDVSTWHIAYNLLRDLQSDRLPGNSLYHKIVQGDNDLYLSWTLTAFTPWEYLEGSRLSPSKSKALLTSPIMKAAKDGIKANNKLCSALGASHLNRMSILALKKLVDAEGENFNQRSLFAMAICKWEGCGGPWKLQVLYCILVEAMGVLQTGLEPPPSESNISLPHHPCPF